MTTPVGESAKRQWWSRAFVQPLLITVAGALASIALYLVAVRASMPPCTDEFCGLGIGRLISAALLLLMPLTGMIVTGLVVGRSVRDAELAGRAILVGMAIVWLTLMVATEQDVNLSSVVSVVSVVLVGIGFVLGRRGRLPSRAGGGVGTEDQPDATDPD